ncbi:unnamed protein product [Peniophora sp. CBMAI 1063]|nr:unnamed protein product [Peniophora sp. CBMAI 1063]
MATSHGTPAAPTTTLLSPGPVTSKITPCAIISQVLDAIEIAARALPDAIPEAVEADELTFFATRPPRRRNINNKDRMDVLCNKLEELFENGWSTEDMAALMCCGTEGVGTLVAYTHEVHAGFDLNGYGVDHLLRRCYRAMKTLIPYQDDLPSTPPPYDWQTKECVDAGPKEVIDMYSDMEDAGEPGSPLHKSKEKQVLCQTFECPGIKVNFPDGQIHHTLYPFALHLVLSLPWDYASRKNEFFVYATGCLGGENLKEGPCAACSELEDDNTLLNIVRRFTTGVHDNSQLAYHGIAILMEKYCCKLKAYNRLRLQSMNQARKLVGRDTVINAHKQLVHKIASNNIKCVDRALHASINHREGVHTTIEQIQNAAKGMYSAKGFNQADRHAGILLQCLGGQQVADIVHRIYGSPAAKTSQANCSIPPLTPSPSTPTATEIEVNILESFSNILELLSKYNVLHTVAMVDEVTTEKRPRWWEKLNKFLGLCCKHTKTRSLEYASAEDMVVLFEDLRAGKVHLTKEVR